MGPVWSRCWWRKGGGGAWRHEIEAACEVERGWRVRGRGRGEGKDTVQRRDALGPLATSADQLELTNRVLVEEFLHPFVKHLAHILLVSFILKKIAICLHVFPKNLTKHPLIFCTFGRKTQVIGNFAKVFKKFIMKMALF